MQRRALRNGVLIGLVIAASVTGCVTISGNECQRWQPITLTADEVETISIETARQILAHNEKWSRVCGKENPAG